MKGQEAGSVIVGWVEALSADTHPWGMTGSAELRTQRILARSAMSQAAGIRIGSLLVIQQRAVAPVVVSVGSAAGDLHHRIEVGAAFDRDSNAWRARQ